MLRTNANPVLERDRSLEVLPRRLRLGGLGTGLTVGLFLAACGTSDGDGSGSSSGGQNGPGGVTPITPSQSCQEVRLTAYDAGIGGMCEYNDALPVLPAFVRDNITLAIAEPFAGGSAGGDFAESCGECWEISTISSTQTVMVTNLCPANDDNPVCQGPALHFDVSREAGAALGHEGITIGEARPVPCPVEGNVHAVVRDRNDFFIRLVFANHRIPIRSVDYRIDGTDAWRPMNRNGGAWAIGDAGDAIGPSAPGISFRLTSPDGEVAEGTAVLPANLGPGQNFDIGAQFAPRDPEGGMCTYVPDGTVFADAFGGSDPVLWEMNTYGGAQYEESAQACAAGDRCLQVTNYPQWSGAVFRINDALPVEAYDTLTLSLRASEGRGTVEVVVGEEGGEACDAREVEVDETWQTVSLDLGATCDGVPEFGRIALINRTQTFGLTIDEVAFR
ncbi:MAG: hypothetical protein AAF715_32705 [Myxococcota bacterium]